jgi:hypothetical protein
MAQRRTIHEVTLEELTASNAEVQRLVGERVPRAFREPSWLFWATAMLARTAAILDSVTGLVERGRRADAEVALRTLYTHVTTFCWLAIDPEPHLAEWQGGSEAQWDKFNREVKGLYRIIPSDDEVLASFGGAKTLKPLEQLADDVDAYWPSKIAAFRGHPGDGKKKELLSFRGAYTAIFRTTSRIAHAEVDSLQASVRARERELVVSMQEPPLFGRSGLALPLTGFAILVYNHHFDWPGEPRVGRMVAALNYEPTEDD